MSLMDMLGEAQGGRLFAAVAASLGLSETDTRSALGQLCPAIAERLHQKAAADDQLFQSLLDVIADNGDASPLEASGGLTSAEAVADGNAILADVYGSGDAAAAALRKTAPGLSAAQLATLAPVAATAVVAALAASNRPLAAGLMEPHQARSNGRQSQGFLAALVSAVVAGIVSALSRRLGARTRRRTGSTGYARTRRRTTSARSRSQTAAVEDIFREVLGRLGK